MSLASMEQKRCMLNKTLTLSSRLQVRELSVSIISLKDRKSMYYTVCGILFFDCTTFSKCQTLCSLKR